MFVKKEKVVRKKFNLTLLLKKLFAIALFVVSLTVTIQLKQLKAMRVKKKEAKKVS